MLLSRLLSIFAEDATSPKELRERWPNCVLSKTVDVITLSGATDKGFVILLPGISQSAVSRAGEIRVRFYFPLFADCLEDVRAVSKSVRNFVMLGLLGLTSASFLSVASASS